MPCQNEPYFKRKLQSVKSLYHYQRQDSMSFSVKTPFDKYKLTSTVVNVPNQSIVLPHHSNAKSVAGDRMHLKPQSQSHDFRNESDETFPKC